MNVARWRTLRHFRYRVEAITRGAALEARNGARLREVGVAPPLVVTG